MLESYLVLYFFFNCNKIHLDVEFSVLEMGALPLRWLTLSSLWAAPLSAFCVIRCPGLWGLYPMCTFMGSCLRASCAMACAAALSLLALCTDTLLDHSLNDGLQGCSALDCHDMSMKML